MTQATASCPREDSPLASPHIVCAITNLSFSLMMMLFVSVATASCSPDCPTPPLSSARRILYSSLHCDSIAQVHRYLERPCLHCVRFRTSRRPWPAGYAEYELSSLTLLTFREHFTFENLALSIRLSSSRRLNEGKRS